MDEERTIQHGHDAEVQRQAAEDEKRPGKPELLEEESYKRREDEGARPHPCCGQPHCHPAATVEVHADDDESGGVGQSSPET